MAIHAPVSTGGHNDGPTGSLPVPAADLRYRPRTVGDRGRCAAKPTRVRRGRSHYWCGVLELILGPALANLACGCPYHTPHAAHVRTSMPLSCHGAPRSPAGACFANSAAAAPAQGAHEAAAASGHTTMLRVSLPTAIAAMGFIGRSDSLVINGGLIRQWWCCGWTVGTYIKRLICPKWGSCTYNLAGEVIRIEPVAGAKHSEENSLLEQSLASGCLWTKHDN